MTKDFDLIEVAVIAADGRSSEIGHWRGWATELDANGERQAHVMVFGGAGRGQYADRVPESRIVRLSICGRLPSREIMHSDRCAGFDLMGAGLMVWA